MSRERGGGRKKSFDHLLCSLISCNGLFVSQYNFLEDSFFSFLICIINKKKIEETGFQQIEGKALAIKGEIPCDGISGGIDLEEVMLDALRPGAPHP